VVFSFEVHRVPRGEPDAEGKKGKGTRKGWLYLSAKVYRPNHGVTRGMIYERPPQKELVEKQTIQLRKTSGVVEKT